MTQLDRCSSCRAVLAADETGRQGCLRCQHSADQHLRDLSGPTGLYAALSGALAPSRTATGPRVSGGSVSPSLGCDSRVLDLLSPTTGVYAVLHPWAEDWYQLMDRQLPTRLSLDGLCGTLRWNLDWAAREHQAWADFARELAGQVARCREVTGEGDPRPQIVGVCHARLDDGTECGGDLTYRQQDATTRCRACHTVAPVDWQAIRAAVTAGLAA